MDYEQWREDEIVQDVLVRWLFNIDDVMLGE